MLCKQKRINAKLFLQKQSMWMSRCIKSYTISKMWWIFYSKGTQLPDPAELFDIFLYLILEKIVTLNLFNIKNAKFISFYPYSRSIHAIQNIVNHLSRWQNASKIITQFASIVELPDCVDLCFVNMVWIR